MRKFEYIEVDMKPIRWVVLFLTIVAAVSMAPAWQGGGTAKQGAGAKAASAKTIAGPIDINHASKEDLETLPGIGDAYANAIIKNRRYRNKAQLLSRNVIPPATYKKIKDKIIAKQ